MKSAEKLRLLRRRMQEQGMDAYVVVTDDFHGSEYVGDYFKAREDLSGFTGSAGADCFGSGAGFTGVFSFLNRATVFLSPWAKP